MSLVHLESFDRITSAQLLTTWLLTGGTGLYSFESGRTNNCLKFASSAGTNGYLRHVFGTINTNLVIGFAFKYTNEDQAAATPMIAVGNTTSTTTSSKNFHFAYQNGENILQLHTSSAFRDAKFFNWNIWNYLELKLTTHGSTGTLVVKVNGVEFFNYTGDTQNSVDDSSCITFAVTPSSNQFLHIDDYYVCNGSGSVNNDFLGPIRIETLYPNADGTTNQWDLSAGTDSYALVDDDGSDDDTTYIEEELATEKDLFAFADLTGSGIGTINGIQVFSYVKLDSAGSKTLAHVARSSTTEGDSSGITVDSTSYSEKSSIYEQDPDTTSAWTESGVNAAEFGVKVSA